MNTCEDHDSVVVYTGNKCPVCELVEERDDFEKERDEARKERDKLDEKVDDLEFTIEELEGQLEKLRRRFLAKELKELEGGSG